MGTHWKSMTDRTHIAAFDLNGKDVHVKIVRVSAGELTAAGGRKSKKPVVFFDGKDKSLPLNSTNAKTIAAMYGNYVEKWIGKWITLYPTTTEMAGETVEAIRVRPIAPRGKAADAESETNSDETDVVLSGGSIQ